LSFFRVATESRKASKTEEIMTISMKTVRSQVIQALFVAVLSPAPPVAAQMPNTSSVPAARGHKSWRVKYVGGAAGLARGTRVTVSVNRNQIVYQPDAGRGHASFSIPTPDVADVSGELVTGTLEEKVFGPGEPDYLEDLGKPCADRALARMPDLEGGAAAAGCLAGSLALEVPYAILFSALQNLNFKDHFVRVRWQEQGGADPEVVFKVSGRDYPDFLETLESATNQSTRGLQEESPPGATDASLPTPSDNRGHPSSEASVKRSLVDQCLAEPGSESPLGSSLFSSELTRSCAAIREAHDRLLAKPEGE
jgi:hypothetical protein